MAEEIVVSLNTTKVALWAFTVLQVDSGKICYCYFMFLRLLRQLTNASQFHNPLPHSK